MPENRIRALLFDMDGLMADTERLFIDSEREIARSYGKELTDAVLRKLMSRKPLESMGIFARELGIPESPEKLLAVRDQMMIRRIESDLKPMPGLFEILDYFRGRKKLAVATGNNRMMTDLTLDKLGVRKYFDHIQTSENVANGKPDPDIYLAASDALGVGPAHCAVLEDSENGVASGRAAGCFVIAVLSVYSQGQDFSRADRVVTGLPDALTVLKELDAKP